MPVTVFIQDQTLWEHFLCKAGINPMAAQLVLGMLKKPPTLEESSRQRFGLAQLAAMSADDRERMFARLLGQKAMGRINEVLDAKW